jgi:hypothetical protein
MIRKICSVKSIKLISRGRVLPAFGPPASASPGGSGVGGGGGRGGGCGGGGGGCGDMVIIRSSAAGGANGANMSMCSSISVLVAVLKPGLCVPKISAPNDFSAQYKTWQCTHTSS